VAVTDVRSLMTYVDESGQCRIDEPTVIAALLTNGTPVSEDHLHQFAQQLHQNYGANWKAQEWKRRDVIRLAALIRAKGWMLLRGYYKPPGDLASPWAFIEFLKRFPQLEEPTRATLIREAEELQPHIRVWLIALFDAVGGYYKRDQIAAGDWIFHSRTAPSELLLSYYLDFALMSHNLEAWRHRHATYSHISIPELFRCRFRSDHEFDGLRIVDYCAHFYRRTITPFGNEAEVDMAAHALFIRVLETPNHHLSILRHYEDIPMWIDTVAEVVELAGRLGVDEARRQLSTEAYKVRVLGWAISARFLP
jgi:hypothetical protein